MFVINRKKLFVIISAVLVAVSLGLIGFLGLEMSIEFTGGNIIEVEYPADRPAQQDLLNNLAIDGFDNVVLQPVEDNRYVLRSGFLDEAQTEQIRDILTINDGSVVRESSIGPSVGQELRTKSIMAIIIVSIGIVAFVAFAFRKVSKPVQSWKYGAVAVIALIQDIIVTTGSFALLGYLLGYEIDLLFVMGILVILGYSVNDTIVVFDRVRENLLTEVQNAKGQPLGKSFSQIVGEALNQTLARSINTSLTTFVVLLCLYIFGGESTNHFALMLMVGIISGTYSSIFLASPLLVYLAGDKEIDVDNDDTKKMTQTRQERRAAMADPGLM